MSSYPNRPTLRTPSTSALRRNLPSAVQWAKSPLPTPSSIASLFPPSRSMFVIDPKTLATRFLVKPFRRNAYQNQETGLVGCFVWLRSMSERWFSHVMLLIAVIGYACIGGWIFSSIEGEYEVKQNEIIRELRQPILTMANQTSIDLWFLRNQFPMPTGLNPNLGSDEFPVMDPWWSYRAAEYLEQFERTVSEQCHKRLSQNIETNSETNKWNFMGSVFFSLTVFTTIGYGDNPPKTLTGKWVTMVYAFVGIPLLLMLLADFGRIFTRSIKFAVLSVRRLFYLRSVRQFRRINRKGTRAARIQQAVMDGLARIQRQPPFYVDPITGKPTLIPPRFDVQLLEPSVDPMFTPMTSGAPPTVVISPPASHSPTITPDTPIPPETLLAFSELDDEFNLPISLALFILMLYLLLGAILFWASEQWTLFHSFYFVFISMSTIGFGDFIPSRISVLMCAFIYLLFGLALTSMCINVIQEKLSSTFERARVTIGESIGLDPTTPITIINANHSGSSKDSSKESSPSRSNKGSKEPNITRNNKPEKETRPNLKPTLKFNL